MNKRDWLDYLTALGAVATPIIVLALSALGWRLRHRFERRVVLEDKLREDRIVVYNAILEPFIHFLISDKAWEADPENKGRDRFQIASQKMLSPAYRNSSFRLVLMGSDAVVNAYNDLMQFFFAHSQATEPSETDIGQMLSLLGTMLLEIRRSMGNEATKLDNWGMLEWFITDARRLRRERAR